MNQAIRILEQRVARLEKAVFGQQGKTKGHGKSKATAKASDYSGPTGGVRFLISKGFFKKKKALPETRSALAERDYHYSVQAVHEALKRLTAKDGPLVALREGGKKVYVNRK
jgi:hypothetical protein